MVGVLPLSPLATPFKCLKSRICLSIVFIGPKRGKTPPQELLQRKKDQPWYFKKFNQLLYGSESQSLVFTIITQCLLNLKQRGQVPFIHCRSFTSARTGIMLYYYKKMTNTRSSSLSQMMFFTTFKGQVVTYLSQNVLICTYSLYDRVC